ncbi:hypothetical protein EVJ58_g10772, partial [Rhodofomes roseus]
ALQQREQELDIAEFNRIADDAMSLIKEAAQWAIALPVNVQLKTQEVPMPLGKVARAMLVGTWVAQSTIASNKPLPPWLLTLLTLMDEGDILNLGCTCDHCISVDCTVDQCIVHKHARSFQ